MQSLKRTRRQKRLNLKSSRSNVLLPQTAREWSTRVRLYHRILMRNRWLRISLFKKRWKECAKPERRGTELRRWLKEASFWMKTIDNYHHSSNGPKLLQMLLQNNSDKSNFKEIALEIPILSLKIFCKKAAHITLFKLLRKWLDILKKINRSKEWMK